jgi:hypothetical protein
VEQLPRKVDQIVFCQLRPSQARAYNRIIQSADVQVCSQEICLPPRPCTPVPSAVDRCAC